MIDEGLQFQHVVSQLQYFADRMRDSVKLYITLITAIIGGIFWLFTQTPPEDVKKLAEWFGPLLVLVIGLALSLQVAFDFQSWFRYRERKSALLLETNGKSSSFPYNALQELLFITLILGTSVFGVFKFWKMTGTLFCCHWLVATFVFLVPMGVNAYLMANPHWDRKKAK